jgi:hypothetical protein
MTGKVHHKGRLLRVGSLKHTIATITQITLSTSLMDTFHAQWKHVPDQLPCSEFRVRPLLSTMSKTSFYSPSCVHFKIFCPAIPEAG